MATTAIAKPAPTSTGLVALEAAWKQMSAPLRDAATAIKEITDTEIGGVVKNRWLIGQKIDEIKKDPEKYGVEGTSLRLLSDALGLHKDILNNCQRFFSLFTDKQLETLLTSRTKAGKAALSWSHIRELICVADTKARKQFLEMALKEDLPTLALHDRIAAFLGKGVSPTSMAGSGVTITPKTFEGAMKQILAIVTTFKNRQDLWSDPEKGVVALFEELAPDKIDGELLARLQAVEEDLQETQSNLTTPLGEITKIKLKVEQLLTKKQKTEEAASATDDEEDEDEVKPKKADPKKPTAKGKPADKEEE